MSRSGKLAALLIPALFLFGGWTLRNKLAADRQGEWVAVSRGDLVTGVDVIGTLAAVDSDSFGPPQIADTWDFKVSMLAPEGAEVTKGRPVLAFDTTELQKKLDEKTAESEQARKEIEKTRADLALRREDGRLELAEAEAKLRKSALKLDAPADLLGIKDRKAVELDHALAQRECDSIHERLDALERAAAAQIALLESKQSHAAAIVANTQDAIRRMTIIAPRNGTVVYLTNWRGEKKKVGDNCWRMERVIEIPDLARMIGKGEVDEVDAGKITLGQRVSLRLDSHPDDEWHGTIRNVARTVEQHDTGEAKDPLKVLVVEIALDRSEPAKMRPGMRFRGTVELARSKNALLIPRAAVFVTDRGPVAYRRGLLSVTTVPLRLGRENEKSVEVLSGLSAGDRVLMQKSAAKEEQKS